MPIESYEWMIIREDIHELYRNVANPMLLKMKVLGEAENALKNYRWLLGEFLMHSPNLKTEFNKCVHKCDRELIRFHE